MRGGALPVLLAILALVTPRVVIVLVWLFSYWFEQVYETILWPILGFVFLPTTLLWHSVVLHNFGGHWNLWAILGVVVTLAIDLSPASGRRPS